MKDLFKGGVFEKRLNIEGPAPKELSEVLHQLNNWPDSQRLANQAVNLIKAQYGHNLLVDFACVLYNVGDIKAVKFEKAVTKLEFDTFKEITDNFYAFFEDGEICMEFNRGWTINDDGERIKYNNRYGGAEFVNPYGQLVSKLW
jgi:hypothetical protein